MKKTMINLGISVLSLLLFSGCNSTNTSTSQSEAESQVTEWSIKFNAIDSNGKLGDTNIPLGQVYPATDNIDRYDLASAPHPFGGDFMEVVYTIDDNTTEFSTNYHSVKKDQYDSWTFVVKTNDPDRTVTLSWPGIFKVESATDEYNRVRLFNEFLNYDTIMEKMQLVDMRTGEVVSAVLDGKVQSYTFNMDGETERTFKWEYLSEKAPNQPQDASSKESAIELSKQFGKKYQQTMEPDSFPPEFN
jgi:hypothetical protein